MDRATTSQLGSAGSNPGQVIKKRLKKRYILPSCQALSIQRMEQGSWISWPTRRLTPNAHYIAGFCNSWLFGKLGPFNPILTGGGVNLTPPCTKSATVSRPPLIATRLFMTFFFQVLRIFWYQVCENRTIGREVTRLFVLARRLKNCPKSAFCICLCTKHMEITDFLKML